ncbi:MAG: hypothetical protein ACOC2U_01860 [bacterium]
MIPDKLYIPTSTLNFNNIMSSESISPASFYSRRGFGYKRFEKVGPNNLDNRIILYGKYPVFDIDDKELENYPMVVEIDTKTIKKDVIQEKNGLFYSDETIYLNPFTTNILFRNEQEKRSTLSKAEPSIESKMVPLYANCIEIKREDINSFNWTKTEIKDTEDDFSRYISKDRRINKLKGFLYSYLIAANKSVSPDVVFLKKHVKRLQNTLSAIITSPDGRVTRQQNEQLNSLYKLINDKFSRFFLEPLLKEKSEKYKCDFYNMLQEENLYYSWLRENKLLKYQIQPFNIPTKDKEKALENYIANINSELSKIELNQRKSKIEINSLPELQHNRIINIPRQKEFLKKLFNEYLDEAYNSEDFIQSRYEFAKSGGKIFKEELKNKWEGSPWQTYINSLLKNLNEYKPFDIKSANNLTLESFAAFCQKGESDIDKLEEYLISNEIGDFRIAFGLWGIIFGFANMPKTLTNELFLSEDTDYISNVYKSVFKQVQGIELDGKIDKTSFKKQPILEKPAKEVSQTKVKKEELSKSSTDNQDIRYKLKDCNLKSEQIDCIAEIYKKNHSIINNEFFDSIEKIRGIGKKTIEKIKKALDYDFQSEKTIHHESLSLFKGMKPELGNEFYKDSNVFYHIETLIPQKLKKKFKEDLDWFQDEYKKGSNSQYYDKAKRDNSSVIDSFERYIMKKKYAKQLNIETLVNKLKDLYLK